MQGRCVIVALCSESNRAQGVVVLAADWAKWGQ